ncbi:hypothetical protein GCM10023238_26810 [Streptomyces heliomycini]
MDDLLGSVTVTDYKPPRNRAAGDPDRGGTAVKSPWCPRCAPAPGYGRISPWVHEAGGRMVAAGARTHCAGLGTEPREKDGAVVCSSRSPPRQRGFVLAGAVTRLPAEIPEPEAALEDPAFWENWTSQCTYTTLPRRRPPFAHHPEGDDVSAQRGHPSPTNPPHHTPSARPTSLPRTRGKRNWDYRYTWLQRCLHHLAALLGSGLFRRGRHLPPMLLRAVAGDTGEPADHVRHHRPADLAERELGGGMPGYENSARSGSATSAADQVHVSTSTAT